MSGYTTVPFDTWREVRDFFAQIVSPCKDCVRGNSVQCWNSQCPAFRYRAIAHRVLSAGVHTIHTPPFVMVENEIINTLRAAGKPLSPSMIQLHSTRSKSVKSHTISRLVRQGRIVEQWLNDHARLISLPKKEPEK